MSFKFSTSPLVKQYSRLREKQGRNEPLPDHRAGLMTKLRQINYWGHIASWERGGSSKS